MAQVQAGVANAMAGSACHAHLAHIISHWLSSKGMFIATMQALTEQEMLMLLSGMPGMQYVPSQEWLATAVQRLDPALAVSCGLAPGASSSSSSSLTSEQRRQLQELVQKLQYKAVINAPSSVAVSVAISTQEQEQGEATAISSVELVLAA